MQIEKRLLAVNRLTKAVATLIEDDRGLFSTVAANNPWFSPDSTKRMLKGVLDQYLAEHLLINWLARYSSLDKKTENQVLGIVMAGNIPMVGFHDLLCGIVSGYQVKVKLSDKDSVLIPYLLKEAEIGADLVECIDRLPKCDRIIATGSNNSSRYFEYYFKDIPHLIRKNRTSVAVLDGSESSESLQLLGDDILAYYGLGCRNVSTICVPQDYNVDQLFDAILPFESYQHHNKYFNNFEYTTALYLLNKEDFKSNGFFIVRESEELFSRISTIHIRRYKALDQVAGFLDKEDENIQCVATNISGIEHSRRVSLGQCQQPTLSDYADGIDTMEFLSQN